MLRPKIFCKIGALFEKAGMLLKIAARASSPTTTKRALFLLIFAFLNVLI